MQAGIRWLDRKSVRVVVTILLTAFTTGAGYGISIIQNATWKIIVLIIGITCAVLQVVYSLHCASIDKAREENIARWQRRLGIYKELFESSPVILDDTAERINAVANSIIREGVVPGDGWRFQNSAKALCREIRNICRKLCIQGDGVNVYYVQVMNDNCTEVKMIAKTDRQTPKIWNVPRKVTDERSAYFDLKMFASKHNHIEYRLNSKDVDNVFEYKDRERESGKIEQFLFIPIVCGENKIIGMVEIILNKGSKIAETDAEMEEVHKYLQIYLSTFVMLSKVEKATYALPPAGRGDL